MAVDKLVDSTKLDACLDAEADAIRAKTGGTDPIPFDFANNKGFADVIAAIPSGGGSTPQTFTFDKTITTEGGRDAAHALITGLLPFASFEVEGYAYLVGATSPSYNQRINFGFTSEPFATNFEVNADGDTTPFKITGEFSEGLMTYKYYYNGVLAISKSTNIMYDGFAFHWITIGTENTPVVIHSTVTGV